MKNHFYFVCHLKWQIFLSILFLCSSSSFAQELTEASASTDENVIIIDSGSSIIKVDADPLSEISLESPEIPVEPQPTPNESFTRSNEDPSNQISLESPEIPIEPQLNPNETSTDYRYKVAWGLFGSGLAITAIGVGIYLFRYDEKLAIDPWKQAGLGIFIGGIALAVVGVGCAIVHGGSSSQSNTNQATSLQWSPSIVATPDYQGIGVNIVF